jgi:hypothetical protein
MRLPYLIFFAGIASIVTALGSVLIAYGPQDKASADPSYVPRQVRSNAARAVTPSRTPTRIVRPSATQTRTPVRTPTRVSVDAGSTSCRSATAQLLDPLIVGRHFAAGDRLVVEVSYQTDGCTGAGVWIHGYHEPRSSRYQYYCPTGCGGQLGSGFADAPHKTLEGATGTVVFSPVIGAFPPANLSSPPDLDGFVFCNAVVTFDDNRFGGSTYEVFLGKPCSEVD